MKNSFNPTFFKQINPWVPNCIGSGCIGMPGFNPTPYDFHYSLNAVAGNTITTPHSYLPPEPPAPPETPVPQELQLPRDILLNNNVRLPDVKNVINTVKKNDVNLRTNVNTRKK